MEQEQIGALETRAVHSPLVSIVLLAYNHLDYTRQCVESLYAYTSHIDFELITVNNGSDDGTEEYFNSLPNQKKIGFPENIGVDKAINCGFRIAEGQYTLNLSNDIVLTANWLDNLLTCMESDEKIGMVVPVCSMSSNYQQITLPYEDMEKMQEIAKLYNVSNPRLWEDRIRLVTYTCLFRTDLQKAIGGFDEDFNPGAYDDDAISFTIRRAGYRIILARDTFVHHYGSVTFAVEYTKNNLPLRNRNLFRQKFGIDSWQAGMIDWNVVRLPAYDDRRGLRILGIGGSCGATLLQMKNACRSAGGHDIDLYYLAERRETLTDLRTICTFCTHCDIAYLPAYFGGRLYDYIVVESEANHMKLLEGFFTQLSKLLNPGGQLVCKAETPETQVPICQVCRDQGLCDENIAGAYYMLFTKPVEMPE